MPAASASASAPRPLASPWLSVSLASLSVLGLGFAAAFAASEGVAVGGVAYAEHEIVWPSVERHADIWLGTPVTVDTGGTVIQATRRQLGARVDLAETLAAARSKPWLPHPFEARESPLVVDVDTEQVRRWVLRARQDATVPEGSALAHLEGIRAIEAALTSGAAFIALPTHPQAAPTMPESAIGTFDVILGRFSTEYQRVEAGRRRNIEKAAEMVDRLVLEPGERFSYNETLGERTLARGFRPAREIANGRIVDGVGGGICQTAGTLHAAAFLAGLPIEEHHHHSRESSYIDQGLDAMVSWPENDLAFVNDLPFPIQIWALARQGVVEVQIRGAAATRAVRWRSRVVERTPHRERELPAPELRAGARELLREGKDGVVIERIRVVTDDDGEHVEERTLRYPPLDRLVRVGG